MKYALAALTIAVSLLAQPSLAQTSRQRAIQRCTALAQARFGTSFERYRDRSRYYRACMHRYGFRP